MADGVQFKITGAEGIARALEEKPPIVARRIIATSLLKAVEPWRQEMIARVRRGWHLFSRTAAKGVRGPRGGYELARERRRFTPRRIIGMNGKHGRQRTLALIGTLAALLPAGTAWSQTAPPFAQLLRQARDTPRVTALDADVARAGG